MHISLKQTISRFPRIGLDEMTSVSLMDRLDTKFIFHQNKLNSILEEAVSHYQILEVEGERISTYENLYFDTENLKFYKDHHNGKMNRTKVRMRKYVDTNACYIEVKKKNNKGRTDKKRQRIADFETVISEETARFLDSNFSEVIQLRPVISNNFKRITLVSLTNSERITFDLNLYYIIENEPLSYENLVIAEIKQATLNRGSELFKILKSNAIYPFRVSKYCIGMVQKDTNLKSNAFKEKIRRINKVTTQ